MFERNVCLLELYYRLHVSIFSLTYFLGYIKLSENIVQTYLNRTCAYLIVSVQDAVIHIRILLLDIFTTTRLVKSEYCDS